MPYKVGMVSLGCPKNQVDAEIMLSILNEHGYEITQNESEADAIIVNTCGFIEDAKKEAIENILEVSELKKTGALKVLVVTGCMAQRYGDQVKEQLPEIDVVVGIGANKDIAVLLDQAFEGKSSDKFDDVKNLLMNHSRILASPKYTAYLRIADGCDNCCTYCAIPLIRGRFNSRKMEDIISEATILAGNGVKEIIVIAQDTTAYGEDIYGTKKLPELLSELCKVEGIEWIRVLYTYPERLTDELIDVLAKEEKIVKYLDIPLQHCDELVLKRMNRSGSRESLTELINKLREKVDGITIRTTFIVGFPGETDEQYTSLCEFVKEMKFDRMGCFAYSPEEDTAAATFPDQIPVDIKLRRQEILMDEQHFINEELTKNKIGSEQKVLVEGYDDYIKCNFGRSTADSPDIDCKVFFKSTTKLDEGDLVSVQINDCIEYDLLGEQII